MHDFPERFLEATILLIICCDGVSGERKTFDIFLMNSTTAPVFATQQTFVPDYYSNKNRVTKQPLERNTAISDYSEYDQPRSYYSPIPASPFIPMFQYIDAFARAFDPISVLASLAFLAFLLQSFAALFDRTRSIIPTIVSGRRSNPDFLDIESRVLRALEEYASLSSNLLESEKENKKSTT